MMPVRFPEPGSTLAGGSGAGDHGSGGAVVVRVAPAVSSACQGFIRDLLRQDRRYRLGRKGEEQVRQHAWLADVDWDEVLRGRSKGRGAQAASSAAGPLNKDGP